jgi:hypothetical protein
MNSQGRLAQDRIDKLNSLGFVWRKTVPVKDTFNIADFGLVGMR